MSLLVNNRSISVISDTFMLQLKITLVKPLLHLSFMISLMSLYFTLQLKITFVKPLTRLSFMKSLMLWHLYVTVADHVCEATRAPRLREITNVIVALCCS